MRPGGRALGVDRGCDEAQAATVINESCDSIVDQAIASMSGKTDAPCPWYFSWCNDLSPKDADYRVAVADFKAGRMVVEVSLNKLTRRPVAVDGLSYSQLERRRRRHDRAGGRARAARPRRAPRVPARHRSGQHRGGRDPRAEQRGRRARGAVPPPHRRRGRARGLRARPDALHLGRVVPRDPGHPRQPRPLARRHGRPPRGPPGARGPGVAAAHHRQPPARHDHLAHAARLRRPDAARGRPQRGAARDAGRPRRRHPGRSASGRAQQQVPRHRRRPPGGRDPAAGRSQAPPRASTRW